MNFNNLKTKSITYYKRYYKLVAVATLVTVAVIVGSLVVGDSVRTTLVKRVDERLGNTETIIFSRNSFIEKQILQDALLHDVKGILLSNGFVSISGKLIPVMVWGVGDADIPAGNAKVNPHLYKELQQTTGSDIVLRLPATGLVPSGSLFVTDNYTTSLRLTLAGTVEVEDGGNLNLKNEQTIPFNIFVNDQELAQILETDNKINLILSPKNISENDLNTIWSYDLSGLKVTTSKNGTEITSDRIFIQQEAVDAICKENPESDRLFSYLVNSINTENNSIPYSFVTAVENVLQKDEIILSDYAAHRLNAAIGDTIQLTYFTSHDLKVLKTDTLYCIVNQIVPLSIFQSDSTLSADFPGLSNVENCTDWNSDLPIDMTLITQEDEDYWDLYRNTPKAIISYQAIADDWSNSYGNATAIRTKAKDIDLQSLNYEMFGIQLIHPKEAGLYAARNGVDFSSLFLALGFFIILSAMLLMLVPLSEMIEQRKSEINLLRSLGYSQKRIFKIFRQESLPIVLIASVVGVLAGLIYTFLVMWLLGNVWKGATHTDGFSVYPNMITMLIGLISGIIISLLLLQITLKRLLKNRQHKKRKEKLSLNRKLVSAGTTTVLIISLAFINLTNLKSSILFILIGVLALTAFALWVDYLICRNGSIFSKKTFDIQKMIWATVFTTKKQALLSFFTLAIGVFIVFSVGLNRRGFSDSSQLQKGMGGYSLWCESRVPVYHNISTQEGREKLALQDLPANTEVLQMLRYGADDASCLNLNKVINPTVLGVDMGELKNSDFQIEQSLYSNNREETFEMIRSKKDSLYPVLVDETVLMWGLMLKLGDTLIYEGNNGKKVTVQIAGTLKNSIFQGNILMDKQLFSEIWSDITGSEVALIKIPQDEIDEAKTLLSQALHNYGVIVTPTSQRLKEFYSVTDTYLTIFLTLGGIGLLLGIMSFIIVIRKNLTSRKNEIIMYRTLGFTKETIIKVLYRENLIIPLYAIASGTISSLIGISLGFSNVGFSIWLLTLLFAVIFVVVILIYIKKTVELYVSTFNSKLI